MTRDGIESTALRGWPMLNSVLFGPSSQLVTSRYTCVETLRKAGRSAEEIAGTLAVLLEFLPSGGQSAA